MFKVKNKDTRTTPLAKFFLSTLLQTKKVNLLWKELVEAVARRCSVKKVFLEILQNSQENTCARVSFLIKFQAHIRKNPLDDYS